MSTANTTTDHVTAVHVWETRKEERILDLATKGKFSEEKCLEVLTAVKNVVAWVEDVAKNNPAMLDAELENVANEQEYWAIFDNWMKLEGKKLQLA